MMGSQQTTEQPVHTIIRPKIRNAPSLSPPEEVMEQARGAISKSQQKTLRFSHLSPLWAALLLVLIAGSGMIMLAVVAALIRNYALPRYVSAIGAFVFGLVAVLVLKTIADYFNNADE